MNSEKIHGILGDEEPEVDIGRISFILPVKTVSEFNSTEHWRKKHARHKLQKRHVWFSMCRIKYLIKMPCTITLSRNSQRFLDEHDNLPGSMKYIVDAIAEEITGDSRAGRADGVPGLTWKYQQEKSKKCFVKVIIEF
jgi:hypothetical protein